MKKLLCLFLVFTFLSCDDGDIIVEDFAFQDIDVEACLPDATSGNRTYLFYKVDPINFESLSIQLTTSDDILFEDGNYGPFDLAATSSVEYRKFDAAPGNNYFCSLLPPTAPNVIETLNSRSGQVNLTVTNQPLTSEAAMNNEESPTLDSDDDLIPNYLEPIGQDTDGDGLQDKIDEDDDGDNIPTLQEGVIIIDGQISPTSRDTDGDGILDYLDNDDDGDGILTIQEDTNGDLNPLNDMTDGVTPDYLNANVSVAATPEIATFRSHQYIRVPLINIQIPVLTLTRDGETIIFDNFEDISDFGTYVGSAFQLELTPTFVVATPSN